MLTTYQRSWTGNANNDDHTDICLSLEIITILRGVEQLIKYLRKLRNHIR